MLKEDPRRRWSSCRPGCCPVANKVNQQINDNVLELKMYLTPPFEG